LSTTEPAVASGATGIGLFTPKLVTVLREGYGFAAFKADIVAGLTVAIVAMPLSMALAIASGVGPERGLFTAVVAGLFISLLGGSRVQIGGPTGAFVVVGFNIVARFGYDGLVVATLMARAMLVAAGLARLGTFIRARSVRRDPALAAGRSRNTGRDLRTDRSRRSLGRDRCRRRTFVLHLHGPDGARRRG
jgi:hypothetical protein